MNTLAASVSLERRAHRGEPFRLRAGFETVGGVTVICGPSGAGKSSLLLALLGALRPASGRVALGDRTLFDSRRSIDLPIRKRRIGMVFQEATLFPHLDAARNVAFGFRSRPAASGVGALLERVGAGRLAARRPAELSGGQRQRVALARALASEPAALLLDEPFSALDPSARYALGELLIELQRQSDIPFVHVTHDLGEAVRLGTHLVLVDDGAVVQQGSPGQVIARPATLSAARTVGTENLFRATVGRHLEREGCTEVDLGGTVVQTALLDLPRGSPVSLGLRAEDILLSLRPVRDTSARNVILGAVEEVEERGPLAELRVATPVPFRVLVTPGSLRRLRLERGQAVYLLIKATAFHRLI